jgi:hypothetical protein
MKSNFASEEFLPHEVDRLIHSAKIRIEQQRIHIDESSGSQHQVTSGTITLALMCRGLERLETYRKFHARSRRRNSNKA